MTEKDNTAPVLVSGSTLGRWLNLTGKDVYDLAKAGVLVRVGRDQYSLEESVRGYVEHIRQVSGGCPKIG